ncbi:MAG: sugar phosphate isomerase/epimerase [Flavobacteriaceae bacterium]|nr:sugar phosphate isomerase/epimerase [Flavobacteriaceae bacterium]MDG2235547.1 sugar phosphate isomerase/epimerase [Flavobacteriaceae bacterium]
MIKNQILVFIIIGFSGIINAQKEVFFFQTNWGFNEQIETFVKKAKTSGYDGIEIWAPKDSIKQIEISNILNNYNMKVIFLCGSNPSLTFKKSLDEYEKYLKNTLELRPIAVNSHTGSDFYNFNQNMAFLELAEKLSNEYKIPVYHETHRGRFSYSIPETIRYLEKKETLNLTLDISHWIVVHESLLDNREEFLKKIIQRSNHIHARVGFEEGPQINDPSAPEWEKVIERHLDIWEAVIQKTWNENKSATITTEFGPPGYMPTLPFTQKPVSDQWKANVFIMNKLKKRIKE